MYWDDPVKRLDTAGLSLVFEGFFDWERFGYIDYQYYRVRITQCHEHPHLVGREALVDVHFASVGLAEVEGQAL
jgi:hypothetical protein